MGVFTSGHYVLATIATLTVATAMITISCVPGVDVRGFIKASKVEFKKGTSYPSGWIVEYPPLWDDSWEDPKNFAKVSKEKGFSTLRSYLEDKGAVRGKTNPDVTLKSIPSDKKVKLSRPIVHAGPRELWINDSRVYRNDDCEAAFGSATPTWTVYWSLCKGNCMLRFYWLGLQASSTHWQVYKDCVPVAGSGGGSSSLSSKTPTSTTKAPNKAMSTPKPTTSKAPSKSMADVGGEGDASAGAKNGTLSAGCKAKRS